MADIGRMVKETSVKELSNRLSQQPDFFVTRINRLTASDANALRQQLFSSQAHLVLIKRRLGLRAIEPLKISGLPELLEGSVGVVFAGENVALTAKLIEEFRKAHEDQIAIRGGVIDGQLLSKVRVEQLAKLPPRPQLLAEVIGTLESPMADVIFTLERVLGDLAWLVEQVAEQKPAETPSAAPQTEPTASTEAGTPPQAGSPTGVPGAAGGEPAPGPTEGQKGPADTPQQEPPRQEEPPKQPGEGTES